MPVSKRLRVVSVIVVPGRPATTCESCGRVCAQVKVSISPGATFPVFDGCRRCAHTHQGERDGPVIAAPQGPCRRDPDLWSSEGPRRQRRAVDICRADCPTECRAGCLRMALAFNKRTGLWGGFTEKEREPPHRRWAGERVLTPRSPSAVSRVSG